MKDLKNYWLTRITLKEELLKQVRKRFTPPIYKPKTQPPTPKKP